MKKKINGDKVKKLTEKIYYFFQCLSDHNVGLDEGIELHHPNLLSQNIYDIKGSPARMLCDIYWSSINYELLSKELGEKINFFDLGCGSGRYGNLMEKLSGKYYGSYTGLDIYLDDNFPAKYNHHKMNAENINDEMLININYIFSQSSLEHIENDYNVIINTTEILSRSKKKFIIIHQIPGKLSLFLYAWHGWRQYSLKNLNKIANSLMIKNNVQVYAMPLGGWQSFAAHLLYRISTNTLKLVPFSISKKLSFIFSKFIHQSILNDLREKTLNPIFWTLIITNINPKNIYKV
jgi:hypothetical protein